MVVWTWADMVEYEKRKNSTQQIQGEGQEGNSSSGVVDMGFKLIFTFSKQLLTGLNSECEGLGIPILFHR